jgi:hypothetical protein
MGYWELFPISRFLIFMFFRDFPASFEKHDINKLEKLLPTGSFVFLPNPSDLAQKSHTTESLSLPVFQAAFINKLKSGLFPSRDMIVDFIILYLFRMEHSGTGTLLWRSLHERLVTCVGPSGPEQLH